MGAGICPRACMFLICRGVVAQSSATASMVRRAGGMGSVFVAM